MKFLSFLTFAAAVIAEVVQDAEEVPFDVSQAPLQAHYIISEFPENGPNDVVPLVNTELITLNYTIVNLGPEMKLIGVGGSFRDPETNEIISNLTASRIGPYDLNDSTPVNFHQQVVPNLQPATYILSPELFVVADDQLLQYKTRSQLVAIDDKPISLIDPRLLVLEVLVLAIAGFGGWYYVGTLTDKRKTTKPIESKQFDPSWIPETHIKKKTKKAE